jgi:hypothetical protein
VVASRSARHVKGINIVGLVRALKVYRREHPLPPLSDDARALFEDRILESSWYPLEPQRELLATMYRVMCDEDPDKALLMGVIGGQQAWSGTHRGVLGSRGPMQALKSMGPAWATYFDFGSLDVEPIGEAAARFTVRGYADVPVYHGMTIAGWHLAAAQVAGSEEASVEVVERPWEGAPRQVHIVRF